MNPNVAIAGNYPEAAKIFEGDHLVMDPPYLWVLVPWDDFTHVLCSSEEAANRVRQIPGFIQITDQQGYTTFYVYQGTEAVLTLMENC